MAEVSPYLKPFTAESAAEAGRKSGEVRKKLAERRNNPSLATQDALLGGAGKAAQVLVDVATASSGFEDVKTDLRVKCALVILEYVLGKPRGFETEPEKEVVPEDLFGSLLAGDGGAPDG